MNSITKDLTLGFAQESEIYTIYAKQFDNNMRKISFDFIDEDNEYVVADIGSIYFKEKFSDGSILFPKVIELVTDPVTGRPTMTLTRDMLEVPGLAQCELSFLSEVPNVDPETGKIIGDFDVLTTQTFNIYVEKSTGVGKIHSEGSIDELVVLIRITRVLNQEVRRDEDERLAYEGSPDKIDISYVDKDGVEHTIKYADSRRGSEELRNARENGGTYVDDTGATQTIAPADSRVGKETERVRAEGERNAFEKGGTYVDSTGATKTITATNSRVGKETERNRAETERIAREGAGTYSSHSNYSYKDKSGVTHTIKYEDSRVGADERIRAINFGGTYIDTDGTTKTASNTYTDYSGQTHDASTSDLQGKSTIAIAASALKNAEDNYGFTQNAMTSAQQAADSASSAATSATSANSSKNSANTYKNQAATSATKAATSEANASNSALTAEEWAEGTRGGVPISPVDKKSSKYWAGQAEDIARGLAGTLMPKGTVASSRILDPSNPQYIDCTTETPGSMYNISDEFTTNANFKEGAGHVIPMGSNVYITSDHMWDVLAGSPVTGIKGEAESTYSQGNYNITKAALGLQSKAAVSGGTDVSLVTTGEKYAWNNKSTKPTLTNGVFSF